MHSGHLYLLSLIPATLAWGPSWDGYQPACAASCLSSIYASSTLLPDWSRRCAGPTATGIAEAALTSCLSTACTSSADASVLTQVPNWACSQYSALATCTTSGSSACVGAPAWDGWGAEHTGSGGGHYWFITGDAAHTDGWATRTETETETITAGGSAGVATVTSVRTGSFVALAQAGTGATATATSAPAATANAAGGNRVGGAGAVLGAVVAVAFAL